MTSFACRISITDSELSILMEAIDLAARADQTGLNHLQLLQNKISNRKKGDRDERKATNQGAIEGNLSIDLAPLALDASSEIGRPGVVVPRQDRAGGGRNRRCRRQLWPLHPQAGAPFETGLRVRAVPSGFTRLRCPIKPAMQNYSFRKMTRSRFTVWLRSNLGSVHRTRAVFQSVCRRRGWTQLFIRTLPS